MKLALGSSGPISPHKEILTWLERIGLKLKHLYKCRIRIGNLKNVVVSEVNSTANESLKREM
ncbi:hypothetical protein F4806DRAFT_456372 [Annulohypoxylon nitens]|nr:hypothetical protein F4806DRAFT_456372 [Annulohypoxylon nitens]